MKGKCKIKMELVIRLRLGWLRNGHEAGVNLDLRKSL